ncbi:hypothetical protein [Natronorubrum halophilum]|nr:hypothetical protein [Natronorubrum halophilum]
MHSNVFSGQTEQWYSSVMVGYVVTASSVSIGLAALLATGVV